MNRFWNDWILPNRIPLIGGCVCMLWSGNLYALPGLSKHCLLPVNRISPPHDSVPAVSLPSGFETRMQYDPLLDPVPIIYLSINGTEPLPFLFDTGFTSIWLEPWAARKLGLKSEQPKQARPDGAMIASVERLEVAAAGNTPGLRLETPVLPVRATNLPEGISVTRPAGIVGASFFYANTVRLDFSQKKVTFYPNTHPRLRIPEAIHLPLVDYNPHDPSDLRVSIPIQSGKGNAQKTVAMMIDTGANFTFFDPTASSLLKVIDESPWQYSSSGLSGASAVRPVLLDDLFIGGRSCAPLFAQIARQPDIKNVPNGRNLLGMNLLSKFTVTIDRRNKDVWLEPVNENVSEDAICVPADTTIYLSEKKGQYQIDKIGKPALDSGLKRGDVLLEIDGQKLAGIPLFVAQRLLDGFAGQDAKVAFLRNNERQMASVFRVPLVLLSPKAYVGIEAGIDDDGAIIIAKVDAGSPAEKADIKVGDRIVAANGGVITDIQSLDKLRNAISGKKPGDEILLTIRSRKESASRQVTLRFVEVPR